MLYYKSPNLVFYATASFCLFNFLAVSYISGNAEINGNEFSFDNALKPTENTSQPLGKFWNFQPVISDPLFQDVQLNSSAFSGPSRKRSTGERLTHKTKIEILRLHNLYRGNVTPPAGNMAFMEWDEELERLAQIWADGCAFAHGMPENEYPGTIGQNLYIGTDPLGYLGLRMWIDEYRNYDLREQLCQENTQCGHYVTMAWAESDRLGCAVSSCGPRYLMVCHYSPQALMGIQMYTVAKPCSQCPNEAGSLCYGNVCMTWEQCGRNPEKCADAKCNLKCQNCGKLDGSKCLCKCRDGFDTADCSRPCVDENEHCGKNPGWHNKATCSLRNYYVAKVLCRKMCGKCNTVSEDTKHKLCCPDVTCEDGYVLDLERKPCRCSLLCPGPLCDISESGGASRYSAAYVIAVLLLVISIQVKNMNYSFL